MSDITIPQAEFRALLREVARLSAVCDGLAKFRFPLRTLELRLPETEKEAFREIQRTVEFCREAGRLRIEFTALERRLRELDPDLTPTRPPSRTDIKAAFDASVEFARGEKKP